MHSRCKCQKCNRRRCGGVFSPSVKFRRHTTDCFAFIRPSRSPFRPNYINFTTIYDLYVYINRYFAFSSFLVENVQTCSYPGVCICIQRTLGFFLLFSIFECKFRNLGENGRQSRTAARGAVSQMFCQIMTTRL